MMADSLYETKDEDAGEFRCFFNVITLFCEESLAEMAAEEPAAQQHPSDFVKKQSQYAAARSVSGCAAVYWGLVQQPLG